MAATTVSADPAVRALQDRMDVTDVLYRYASTIDRFDAAGLRSVLADDVWAQYGNAEPVSGGDAVASWIGEATASVVWQHHLLSVYHVEVEGDLARALVYHTSHQVFDDAPDTAKLLVGRYHNELRRGGRPRVHVAAPDHDRGVATRSGAGDGRTRRGDPCRGRRRGVPARAPG